jgi:nucleoside-diphosphate kinase
MEGRQERTFVMIKPDGVQRRLVGEIISRFERRGYKLVALREELATESTLRAHYAEHEGKGFFPKLLSYVSSGPVVAMVWEGTDVVAQSRKLIGSTRPLEAAPGTIRGDLSIDVGRNIVHGSDSVESAQREINIWFPLQQICSWQDVSFNWIYE